jgi:hypothetical protein
VGRIAVRVCSSAALLLLVVLGSTTAAGGDNRTTVELTLAETRPSSAADPAWGWWNADKYDDWQPGTDEEVGLVAARVVSEGDTYTVLLAAERYPTLHASASWVDPATGGMSDALTAELETYDLALGQRYVLSRGASLVPWVGLTYLHIEETRASRPTSAPAPDQPAETADTRLWGAVLGVDGAVPLASRLAVTVRLVARWGQGKREARLRLGPVEPGVPEVEWVKLEDDTSRAMYGAEVGLRWRVGNGVDLATGWQLRDWRYDHGPASFAGAFARLGVGW